MSIPLIIDAQMRNRDSSRHTNIIDAHHLHFSSRFAHSVTDRYKRIPSVRVRPLLFVLCKSINEWPIMINCSMTIKTLAQGAQIISSIKTIFSVFSLSDLFRRTSRFSNGVKGSENVLSIKKKHETADVSPICGYDDGNISVQLFLDVSPEVMTTTMTMIRTQRKQIARCN